MTGNDDTSTPSGRRAHDLDTWVRPVCAFTVAAVAAYASYIHQRDFALQGGADTVSASLWPLSVDGLLLLSTAGLLKHPGELSRRARWSVRASFLLGIAVSLAANIAAAPTAQWKPVLVAGWPPVALLLSVELLIHRPEPTSPDHSTAEEADLVQRARSIDARHRERHLRPASAETLRKQLHIGAARSRELAAAVRDNTGSGRGVRGSKSGPSER
ncbi:hypothetical protein DF268_11855 [Streptomyces sp. V2]|uniref:DUF2637 domain-containing protein n=1 Tax=Streptomyces niveiscabiei TaxID=164115 RepID=A0ABW9I599_9ACTN|nr:DUF2637 domain-containing protein [Streptomyces sp. V2]PWG13357.1 hypothetical protein DF268_11855 [Streptomyces sp. V2]